MKRYFPFLYFLISCTALFFIYYPAREGRFVHDFIGWASNYDHFTWSDIFKCKDDHSYHLGYHILFYVAYKFFHIHAVRWLLLSSVLYAGVATLQFILFKKILQQANNTHAFGIALTGSILTQLSPYICEPFAWGATLHYSITAGILLISWLLIIKYFETKALNYLLLAHGAFLIGIFTLEISLVFPFIIAIYLWFWNKPEKINLKQSLIILLPQFAIIVFYFMINNVVKGNIVGHYGAAVHLNLAPPYMASQFASYLVKYVGYGQFFQYPNRDVIYSFLQRKETGYLLFILLYVIPFILFIIRFKKMNVAWRLGFALYFMMCFALLPTQNLYFMYLFRSENDRLGYFFSLFFYILIAYALVKSLKWFGYTVLLVYAIFGFHFLNYTINNWRQTGDVVKTLINEYHWQNNPGKVHILCLGDNMNGVYLFKNYRDSTFFSEYYEVFKKQQCSPLQQYMYMTMTSEDDSVRATVVNDSTVKIHLLTGNWFMKDGFGAVDYTTTDASVKVEPTTGSYQITFHHKQPGDVYIYESGLHWKQVNGF